MSRLARPVLCRLCFWTREDDRPDGAKRVVRRHGRARRKMCLSCADWIDT